MPSAGEGRDDGERGLAAERTMLAWERMGMAFATLAAITIGAAAHHDALWMLAPAAALFACAALVWHHARRRASGVGAPPGDARVLGRLAIAAASAGVVAAAIVVARAG